MTLEEQVQLLADRAAISDVLHRYATGLDTKNWALYQSVFADEIDMNYSSTDGFEHFTADEWVERWRPMFTGFDVTQHISTNHTFDIRGDEATCVSYMRAIHVVANNMGEDHWTMGGYYTNELVRTGDGWKLRRVTLTTTWTQGNRQVMALALERGREILGIA
jgi:hypothetical protein